MAGLVEFSTFYPDNVIDNHFLEDLGIDSEAAWIREKLGIEERRTVLRLSYIRDFKNQDPSLAREHAEYSATSMSIAAILPLLQGRRGEIDLILANTSTPDLGCESLSIDIAKSICVGDDINCIDLFTACPAFALHLDFLRKHTFKKRYAIGVLTSCFTTVTDYQNRTDSAIWGDGSVAYLYDSRSSSGELRILDTMFDSNPSRAQSVIVKRGGYFHQDGRAVRDFSVRQTARMLRNLESQFSLDWHRDVFIGHQANGTMLEQITKNRNIPDTNHWSNVKYFGNQGAAGSAASLAARYKELTPGQRVVVAVLGAGLSWGSAVLEKGS